MAAKKEIEKAVKLKEFQRAVHKLLSADDQDFLFYAMKEYNTYHSVGKLMLALNSCLDSAKKLDLLPYIRDLIPKHDLKRFDSLAPYNRMANPIRIERPTEMTKPFKSQDSTTVENIRIIHLERTKDVSLGFSIRGGQEHDLGIYLSHVESLSLAEKAGLKVGDQIVRVNNIDFERVSHSSAVLVLTSHDNLKIEVKNVGQVPGQVLQRDSFVWVDTDGKPVDEKGEKEKQVEKRHSISRKEGSQDRLLSSSSKHKIVLHSSKKTSLGFSIRGGSEYGLGIYISEVTKGSPSHQAGLRVGDQILDINGHSFLLILHFEAVHILRSYDTLIMTLKSLGRLPVLPANQKEVQERSPSTSRKRAMEYFKTRSVTPKSSKRPSSATITEETEPEEEDQQKRGRSASMVIPSESKRRPSVPPKDGGSDDVDGPLRPRSNTFGSSSLKRKKQITISPLATHDTRATSVQTGPAVTSPLKLKSKFFEKGIGTQVMLASQTGHAEQLLFDKARRILSSADIEILKEDLDQYEDNEDVKQLVDCLVSIFNTAEKMELLRDIRSLIHPHDIVKFDELISPHEMRALQKKAPESEDSSDTVSIEYEYSDRDIDDGSENDNYRQEEQNSQDPVGGANILMETQSNAITKDSREKSTSLDMTSSLRFSSSLKDGPRASAPELSEVQIKETNLAWYSSDESDEAESQASAGSSSSGNNGEGKGLSYPFRGSPMVYRKPKIERKLRELPNPVVVEVEKDAPYIGLAIVVTANKRIIVKDVRPGGAIDRNNFIKPGFEILQVDNIRVYGKSYHDAAREIADTFKTEGPTVQFIVIPNYY